MIPEPAIEAAKKAFRETHDMGDALMNALTAAAPFIAAQALSDAAEDLTGKRLLDKPFHEYYPEWLNKKADTIRRNSEPLH